MDVRFDKYHGLGNDYLVIDPSEGPGEMSAEAVRLICDRHHGIGADGILLGPINCEGVPGVRIFNPDGSEAEKSGNGLRIFAKHLHETGKVTEPNFNIATAGGMVAAQILDGAANLVRLDMGKVTFRTAEIPVDCEQQELIDQEIDVDGAPYRATCVSIGNPHCVIATDDLTEEHARRLGPRIENHSMFPNRINMQLLGVIDRSNIEIRIYERGVGYTQASGSSSCAAAAAAHRMRLVDRTVNVKMPGGTLLIEIAEDDHVWMTGPVEGVFSGRLHRDLMRRIKV